MSEIYRPNEKKKSNALPWILGLGALGGGAYYLSREDDTPDTSEEVPRQIEESEGSIIQDMADIIDSRSDNLTLRTSLLLLLSGERWESLALHDTIDLNDNGYSYFFEKELLEELEIPEEAYDPYTMDFEALIERYTTAENKSTIEEFFKYHNSGDSDNDNYSDFFEWRISNELLDSRIIDSVDVDGDGLDNWNDADSNNDGINDGDQSFYKYEKTDIPEIYHTD